MVGLYGIGFWMPQVIQTFGLDALAIGFLTAVPYLFASIVMVLVGWNSDRTGERSWHIALPPFIGAVAFAWSASAGSLLAVMVSLTFATAGIYAAVGTFWTSRPRSSPARALLPDLRLSTRSAISAGCSVRR